MTLWPDWNSAESTERWSDILFWVSMLCLAAMAVLEVLGDVRSGAASLVLLGLAEIGSHKLGKRSAALTQRDAARERGEAEQAQKRHDAEAAELRAQADEFAKRLAARHLTPQQRSVLVDAIRPRAGQLAEVTCTMGDPEALTFAGELLSALKDAGWNVSGLSQAMFAGPVWDVGVAIEPHGGEPPQLDQQLTNSLHRLVGALTTLGLTPTNEVQMIPGVPARTIRLIVGTKRRDA